MTRRISSNLNNSMTQSQLRVQEALKNKANNQIASQRRIQELRDDPIAAGHLVRYQSYVTRVENFEKNAQTLVDEFSFRESYLSSSLDVMHRIRELAVTGAHGIYNRDDLANMATEVDELLKELIQNANAVGADGNSLFAGTNIKTTAFDIELGNVPGSGIPLISSVRYNGNIDVNDIEVNERQYLTVDNAGNRTFWAEHQQLFSERDASGWRAGTDSVIRVDGVDITVTSGDNVYALVAKINDSGAAVRASIDPVTNGLNLQTTDARQLWLQDVTGSALADLGIIKDTSQQPPYNIGTGVRVSGGSLFDTVIAFRDALLAGDQEAIGGRVLGSLDRGISNLTTRVAKLGSDYERAGLNVTRNGATALNTTKFISEEGDLDFTKAVTDMKMLDYTYQATLHTAANLYQTTLLNFLR